MLAQPTLPHVLNAEHAAQLLECEPSTIEEHCRAGSLPGIKFGVGWIIPTAALLDRINNIAMEQSRERLQAKTPVAVSLVVEMRGRRQLPELPQ